jgi:hypothetical protein
MLLLIILDRLRRRSVQLDLVAHLLDLRVLFFETRGDNLHSFSPPEPQERPARLCRRVGGNGQSASAQRGGYSNTDMLAATRLNRPRRLRSIAPTL